MFDYLNTSNLKTFVFLNVNDTRSIAVNLFFKLKKVINVYLTHCLYKRYLSKIVKPKKFVSEEKAYMPPISMPLKTC